MPNTLLQLVFQFLLYVIVMDVIGQCL